MNDITSLTHPGFRSEASHALQGIHTRLRTRISSCRHLSYLRNPRRPRRLERQHPRDAGRLRPGGRPQPIGPHRPLADTVFEGAFRDCPDATPRLPCRGRRPLPPLRTAATPANSSPPSRPRRWPRCGPQSSRSSPTPATVRSLSSVPSRATSPRAKSSRWPRPAEGRNHEHWR